MPPQKPTITSTVTLSPTDSKWTSLQLISFIDQHGTARTWEMAVRKTRTSSGVDAVAICPILVSATRPASTILVLQYRPPLDAFTVEWPAGLVDAGETPQQAAVRELREETGYEGTVVGMSPVVASDPGLTNSTMQLCMVECRVGDGDEDMPVQSLEEGEYITRVRVPLTELYERLVKYSKEEGMMVAAKLFYFAQGVSFAREAKYF